MATTNPNQVTLFNGAVPAAGTYEKDAFYTGRLPAGARYIAVQANFDRTVDGASVDVYVQTSLDDEATWTDIMNFRFTNADARRVSAVHAYTALAAAVTPGDGALASNTILNGLLGNKIRVKLVVVGAYTATLRVDAVLR